MSYIALHYFIIFIVSNISVSLLSKFYSTIRLWVFFFKYFWAMQPTGMQASWKPKDFAVQMQWCLKLIFRCRLVFAYSLLEALIIDLSSNCVHRIVRCGGLSSLRFRWYSFFGGLELMDRFYNCILKQKYSNRFQFSRIDLQKGNPIDVLSIVSCDSITIFTTNCL